MKMLLKKKTLGISLAVVMTVAVFGGAVYAVTSTTFPGQVNIVAATNDIKIFSDSSYMFELTKITWNDLPVGGERTRTVYIRNIGNTNAVVTASLVNAPAGVALAEGTTSMIINAGSQGDFNLTLEANTTVNTGSASFTVSFNSTPDYVNP
ncbi:MAG: hypothetical protein PHE50_04930 [Dehalococcoidales bacterium]|nr:hypothetical protein [Dehalococcoidales bacterium]